MKRAERVVAISAGILLFLSAGAWAQPVPAAHSATGQKSAPAKKKKPEKPKKWHGKLVDATCMSKAMNTVAASALHGSAEGAPSASGDSSQSQFVYYSRAPRQGGQSGSEQQIAASRAPMGANGPINMTPADGSHPAVGAPIGNDQRQVGLAAKAGGRLPSINTAAMQKGAMLEQAANECTATSTTSQFGLLTDSGAVMKFGKSGNSKAGEAIKQVELEPKKPVKATVQGLQGNNGRVLVTSVAIKGKHKK